MFGNVFEMVVTIPIAIITMAIHPSVCFAAVAMAAVSFFLFFFLLMRCMYLIDML